MNKNYILVSYPKRVDWNYRKKRKEKQIKSIFIIDKENKIKPTQFSSLSQQHFPTQK